MASRIERRLGHRISRLRVTDFDYTIPAPKGKGKPRQAHVAE
jgi:hypothetical protein